MFREMRRIKQKLSDEECTAILQSCDRGVLAVLGDGGYPYTVPLNFVYENGEIIFHSATSGHKIDAVKRSDKVSFCVIDKCEIVPKEYTSYFRSVVVFGRARILNDDEKRAALNALAHKYFHNDDEGIAMEIDRSIARTCMIAVTPEHIRGKESIELKRQTEKPQ